MRGEKAQALFGEVLQVPASNINDYLKLNGLTAYKFSLEKKLRSAILYRLLNGDIKDVRLSTLCMYATAMGITPADLLTPNYFKQKKI